MAIDIAAIDIMLDTRVPVMNSGHRDHETL